MSKIKKEVEYSNIVYHTKLSRRYDRTQPFFNKENTDQVTARLKEFSSRVGNKAILDLGCGTGFMLFLAKPFYKELWGIDFTPTMLKIAEEKFKNIRNNEIHLVNGNTERMPFEDRYFNIVTANSFLHHLSTLYPTIKEACRVLKKGGVFYSDQDPNYYFWQGMRLIKNPKGISPLLRTEWEAVCKMAHKVRKSEGVRLSSRVIEMAEYQKYKGGFKEDEIKRLFKEAGFSQVNYQYFWFWQEGVVFRDLSFKAGFYFEEHLRKALPLSRSFFKYIRIIAIK